MNGIFNIGMKGNMLVDGFISSWTRSYQKLFSFQNFFSMHSLKFAIFVLNERSAKAVKLEQSKIDIINIVVRV